MTEPELTPDSIPPAPLRGSSLFLVQRDLAERECEALRAEVERLEADRAALLAACRKAFGVIGDTYVSHQEMLDVLRQLNEAISGAERGDPAGP